MSGAKPAKARDDLSAPKKMERDLAAAMRKRDGHAATKLLHQASLMEPSQEIATFLLEHVGDKSRTLAEIYRNDDEFGLGSALAICCGMHLSHKDLWSAHRIICTELLGPAVFEINKALLSRMKSEDIEIPFKVDRYGQSKSAWEIFLLDHLIEIDEGMAFELASMLAERCSAPAPPLDDWIERQIGEPALGSLLGALRGAPTLAKIQGLPCAIDMLAQNLRELGADQDELAAEAFSLALALGAHWPDSEEILAISTPSIASLIQARDLRACISKAARDPKDASPDSGRPRI